MADISDKQLEQLNRTLAQLTRDMQGLTGQLSRSSSPRRVDGNSRSRDDDSGYNKKTPKKYDQTAEAYNRITGALTSDMAKSRSIFRDMTNSWKSNTIALDDFDSNVSASGANIFELGSSANRIAQNMGRFSSHVAKSTKAQSLLYAAQLQNISEFKDVEKVAYFSELSKSVETLDEGAKKALNLIDVATGKLRTDLKTTDFSNIRAVLGELQASVAENLSKTEFSNASDFAKHADFKNNVNGGLDDTASDNRAALIKIAGELQARGLMKIDSHDAQSQSVLDDRGNLRSASELNGLDFTALAHKIETLELSFGKAAQSMDTNAKNFSINWKRASSTLKNADGRSAAVDKMSAYAASGAAAVALKKNLTEAGSQFLEFNTAQIPAQFQQVSAQSVALGMSFRDTMQFLTDNKRMLAVLGPQQFASSMTGMKTSFEKFGFSMKQAGALVGPAFESAISSGINVRSGSEMTNYTESMMNSFQQISGFVGITAQEFFQLNTQLLKSEGTFETLMGMDTDRRAAYAQDLVQTRAKYTLQGLEINQAQRLVETQQQQAREQVKSKMGDSAKIMSLAMASGMGSDAAMEMYSLSKKGIRTGDEDVRLTDLLGQLGVTMEENRVAGYGASGDGVGGILQDLLRELLFPGGALATMMKSGMQIRGVQQAGAGLTPEEQARVATASRGSEAVAKLTNTYNTMDSLVKNSLVASFISAAASAGMLAVQFGILNGSMLKSSAAGLLGGLGGSAGSAAGTAGKLGALGSIAKLVGKASLIGLAAGGIGMIGDSVASGAEAGSAKQGAGIGVSVLGQAAGMAGMGAMLGGPIGAAIGGIAGLGLGLYQNAGSISSFMAAGKPASAGLPGAMVPPGIGVQGATSASGSINTSGQSSLLDVRDVSVAEQLQLIAQTMSQAVTYLQKIQEQQASSGSPLLNQVKAAGSQSRPAQVESQTTFYTGRTA